jgi:hypothetical protein
MKKIWPLKIIKELDQLMDVMPSDEERRNIVTSIESLIKFLDDLKRKVETIPDDSKRTEIKKAVQVIYTFLEEARTDPLKASILGLTRGKARLRYEKASSFSEEELQRVVKEIESTPTPKLTTKLMAYNKRQLISLGKKFNTHVTEKMSKIDIVNKIAKSLENMRGYELLRTLPSEKSEI